MMGESCCSRHKMSDRNNSIGCFGEPNPQELHWMRAGRRESWRRCPSRTYFTNQYIHKLFLLPPRRVCMNLMQAYEYIVLEPVSSATSRLCRLCRTFVFTELPNQRVWDWSFCEVEQLWGITWTRFTNIPMRCCITFQNVSCRRIGTSLVSLVGSH